MTALCWICQQPLKIASHGVCCFCYQQINLPLDCCLRCGLPKTQPTECPYCQIEQPPWQQLIAVSDYCWPLKTLVHQYKYQKKTVLAPTLARLLLLAWRQRQLTKPDLILAVPLHKYRAWRRGFNQSDLIAQSLARWLNCQYDNRLIRKIHATPPQQSLNARQRTNSLKNCFSCQPSVEGKRILLIDDIVTTGSTITEIAKLLKRNGAQSIQIGCICRTL